MLINSISIEGQQYYSREINYHLVFFPYFSSEITVRIDDVTRRVIERVARDIFLYSDLQIQVAKTKRR